jgi:hypothetical protein
MCLQPGASAPYAAASFHACDFWRQSFPALRSLDATSPQTSASTRASSSALTTRP